jgi:hypothetical protein
MSELWIPGAAAPSLDDFVSRLHRQIERFTEGHHAAESHVEVELADGERIELEALSAEPGYGFVTLAAHDKEGKRQLIVPVGAIRKITLDPADERHPVGFALPEAQEKGPEPAA